jgi:hypothetical protein
LYNQFTTSTNYARAGWWADTALLAPVEERARSLGVREIMEALDARHPYSKEQNPEHDAFGFLHLAWQAPDGGRVECVVVRKVLKFKA